MKTIESLLFVVFIYWLKPTVTGEIQSPLGGCSYNQACHGHHSSFD